MNTDVKDLKTDELFYLHVGIVKACHKARLFERSGTLGAIHAAKGARGEGVDDDALKTYMGTLLNSLHEWC